MEILDRYRQAVTDRGQWNNTFQEVGKYVWPDARTIVKSSQNPDSGQVLTVDISDSTAIKASRRMTAGIFSYLMPVGVKWFELKPANKSLEQDREIQRKLSASVDALHSAIWRSNFQREMFMTIRSLVVFGTGCIAVYKVNDELVYRNYHIADIFFEENKDGVIDVVFRRMYYTARQMKQKFTTVPTVVQQALDSKDFTKKFEVVHAVYPRTDYDDSKVDNKKFVSEYILVEDESVLEQGGYDSMPYLIGRFDKSPDELMGRSPAIELLPDIKMVNRLRETFVVSSEKQAIGTLIVEDDSVIGQPAVGSGDVIIKRAGAPDPTILESGSNPALTAEVLTAERQGIMEGFYNDLFDALAQYRNMTAYEVSQRVEEKMVMLAPAISGLAKELFDPLIQRSLDQIYTFRDGPEKVSEKIVINYQGRLAMAMSNMQSNAIEIWIAKWSPYQQFYPVIDVLKIDEAAAASALNAGVPAEHIRTQDELVAYRKESSDMNRLAQQAEIAATGSQAIKNLSAA
jgi:hypothetical protein